MDVNGHHIKSNVGTIAFVVSTGRTGTKAIAHHFDGKEPGVIARHEPPPSRRFARISTKFECSAIDRDHVVRSLVKARRRMFEALQGELYIESNPWLHGCLDALDEVFGPVRLIHVVRHPGSYVTSAINFGAFSGIKGLFNRYVPYWMHKPEQFEENPSRTWSDMSPPERLAWRWAVMNEFMNRGEELFGDRYLRIRYEDLFDLETRGLERIADWLGFPNLIKLTSGMVKRRVNASHGNILPPYPEWDDDVKQRLRVHCAELCDQYGYDI